MTKLFIELASTPSSRAKGLMYRKNMRDNEGMLFKFPQKKSLSFWMKDTYIPLDIAFLEDDGKVLQIEHMSPLNLKSISSNHPCKYALEVNRGWFDKHDVKVGSVIDGLFFKKKITKNSQTAPTDGQKANVIEPSDPERVEMHFSVRDKLKYAEDHGWKVKIMYRVQHDKRPSLLIGPRILSPNPKTHKFDIEDDKFFGYDESAEIDGRNYDIKMGLKSYFIDKIEAMDVVGANGQMVDFMQGVPVVVETETPDLLYPFDVNDKKAVWVYFRDQIPSLQNEDKWDLVRNKVRKDIEDKKDLQGIIGEVKEIILANPDIGE